MKRNSLPTLSQGKQVKKEVYLGVRKMIATKGIKLGVTENVLAESCPGMG